MRAIDNEEKRHFLCSGVEYLLELSVWSDANWREGTVSRGVVESVDRVIKDGEAVRLGGLTLTAHLTPGHTEGNTTWTTVTTEKGRKYGVVFAGSMSINPGVHMVNYAPWPTIAEVYAKSFQTLIRLHCDVFLGPHAHFFDMEAKFRRLNADPNANRFIDSQGYRNYIASFEKLYDEQLKRE